MPSAWVNKYMIARTNEMWNWYGPRKMARLSAEVSTGLYRCAVCLELFAKSQIQVDHIVPIGPKPPNQPWDTYLDKKFCPLSNLQVLCLTDHKKKTKLDVTEMRKVKNV